MAIFKRMKKQIYIFLILALPLSVLSQTWNLLGPDTANISRIDFAVAGQRHVLCADDGFYLYHYGNNTYEYFSNAGLPVTGAAYFDNEKILLTMGNGSYSDGVYTFDINTHEFWPIEYFVYPNYLYYDELDPDGYWIGCDWGGLYHSTNGMDWDTVEMFNPLPCFSMAGHEQYLIVQVISGLTNGYWSDDNGQNWYPSELAPGFPSMDFHYSGDLLGVFPGDSNSSGLWKSDDYGNSWEIEIYQDNLTCVCYDVFSEVLVGYDGEGLGIYTPGAGINLLQNNPPSLNINNIQVNPTMSAPAIFVSTAEGAYFSYDYYVGIEEKTSVKGLISMTPNPAEDYLRISSNEEMKSIGVFDCGGSLLFRQPSSGKVFEFEISSFNPGVYIIVVHTFDRKAAQKFVKH